MVKMLMYPMVFAELLQCVCMCGVVFQFDEEFSARQEAQAELQKQEEKIKVLETQINTLQAQVTLAP